MVKLCFYFVTASIILQMIENEILQNQECVKKAKYDNYCVIENEDVSDELRLFMNFLKLCNACVSIIAGQL